MTGSPKFLIGERSGVEYDSPREYVPDATDVSHVAVSGQTVETALKTGKALLFDAVTTVSTSNTYVVASTAFFPGTTVMGTPTRVVAIGNVASGVTGQVRLFDLTNSVEIASSTYTNTTKTITNLTISGAWPFGEAILEVQFRRTVGSGTNQARLFSAQVLFT